MDGHLAAAVGSLSTSVSTSNCVDVGNRAGNDGANNLPSFKRSLGLASMWREMSDPEELSSDPIS